ncbi:unnamed protein product [Brassica oleracea var. botrytis]
MAAYPETVFSQEWIESSKAQNRARELPSERICGGGLLWKANKTVDKLG